MSVSIFVNCHCVGTGWPWWYNIAKCFIGTQKAQLGNDLNVTALLHITADQAHERDSSKKMTST